MNRTQILVALAGREHSLYVARPWASGWRSALGAVLGASLLLAGCDAKDAGSEAASETAVDAAVPAGASGKVVSVAEEGTRFEPSVSTSQIPEGAWMCDMNGHVHFASMSQGEGECPICSMKLAQKGADEK